MSDDITRVLARHEFAQNLMSGNFEKLAIKPDKLVDHVERLVNGTGSAIVVKSDRKDLIISSIYFVTEALGVEVIEINPSVRNMSTLNSMFKNAKAIGAIIVLFNVETLSESACGLLTQHVSEGAKVVCVMK